MRASFTPNTDERLGAALFRIKRPAWLAQNTENGRYKELEIGAEKCSQANEPVRCGKHRRYKNEQLIKMAQTYGEWRKRSQPTPRSAQIRKIIVRIDPAAIRRHAWEPRIPNRDWLAAAYSRRYLSERYRGIICGSVILNWAKGRWRWFLTLRAKGWDVQRNLLCPFTSICINDEHSGRRN